MSQFMNLFPHNGITWLNECIWRLLGLNSPIHPKNLPDLTGQINKESSRYPVAQGNFGDIWKCTRCGNPPQLVAVKSLRIDIPDDAFKKKFIERLESELQRNIQLEHRNLLPLLGISQEFGPLPAIVSPWMQGGSLTMYLARNSQDISITPTLQILNGVASALQYLHSKSIVHGDLTGNNILINEKGHAIVADHGILILCSELSGTSYITSNVRWTAPENFRISEDEELASSPQLASDIYSFGCIMLQVFTGKVPYAECRSDHQVVVQILRGKKPARPVTPHIEDILWEFMQQCWSDVEHRPSAEKVLEFVRERMKVLDGKS